MSAVIEALKRKYGTPQAVMAKLGIDARLLGRARDEEREEPEEELDPASRLHAILKDKLTERELRTVGELLQELASAEEEEVEEEAEEESEDDEEERDREYVKPRALREHDEFSEDDEPDLQEERGKGVRQIRGTERIPTAMDEAARLAFDQRFPNLARVGTLAASCFTSDGSMQFRSTPRVREYSAKDAERFDRMFPNLKRVA